MSERPCVTAGVTARVCAGCGRALPGGRADRRYCSSACRQRAHRARQARLAPGVGQHALPGAQAVYECPRCQERLIGERRCPECNVFCRRLEPGGSCPHCAEPVAIADLVEAA